MHKIYLDKKPAFVILSSGGLCSYYRSLSKTLTAIGEVICIDTSDTSPQFDTLNSFFKKQEQLAKTRQLVVIMQDNVWGSYCFDPKGPFPTTTTTLPSERHQEVSAEAYRILEQVLYGQYNALASRPVTCIVHYTRVGYYITRLEPYRIDARPHPQDNRVAIPVAKEGSLHLGHVDHHRFVVGKPSAIGLPGCTGVPRSVAYPKKTNKLHLAVVRYLNKK